MAKRFAYLEGKKVRRKEAEKIQAESLEPLESVYIRKETLRAVQQVRHYRRGQQMPKEIHLSRRQ